MTAAATLRAVTIHRGGAPVLADLTLDLPASGVTGLVGPMGGGKSTLVSWLCGKEDGMSLESGEVHLHAGKRPVLIAQHAREEARSEAQSKALAMMRHIEIQSAMPGEGLLCVDEPTAGLFAPEGAGLMRVLGQIARKRPVLLVSHNIAELRGVCDRIVVLAAGRIVSDAAAGAFFAAQAGPEAAHFLRTHGIALPHPDASHSALAPEYRPRLEVVPDILPDSGQGWIVPGALWLGLGAPGGIEYRRTEAGICCTVSGSDVTVGNDSALPDIARSVRVRLATDVVALDPDARLVGAVLLRIGVSPVEAALAISRVMSVPSGFEAWLWEMDLAISLSDDQPSGGPSCC